MIISKHVSLFCLSVFILYGANLTHGQMLPGVQFLGKGYDYFRSEPRPTNPNQNDPGYVDSIFEFTRTSFRTANNGTYLVPTGLDVLDCLACRFSADVQVIEESYDYARTVQEKSQWGGKPIEWLPGQASPEFGNAGRKTSSKQEVMIDSSTSCLVYCAELSFFSLKASDLSSKFSRAVSELNSGNLNAFMERFGTHFIYGAKMGSLYWQRASYSGLEWPQIRTGIPKLDRASRIHLLRSWTDTTTEEAEMARKLDNFALSKFTYNIGASFSSAQTWLSATRESPKPILLTTLAITEVLNRRFFPSDPTIDQKRQLVEQALTDGSYCRHITKQSQCATEDSLKPKEISRFIGNPKNLDTCGVEAVRLPVFGGVFVTGNFPNIVNYRTGGYSCMAGNYYYSQVAASVSVSGQNRGEVRFCTMSNSDPEGVFGGMGSIVFYTGNCNSQNGGLRHYPPLSFTPPSFNQISSASVPNPLAPPGAYCPVGFSQYSLASIRLASMPSCQLNVNVYGCFSERNFFPGAFFGGFYTEWANSEMQNANPITKTTKCRTGYNAAKILTGDVDGTHHAYACMKA